MGSRAMAGRGHQLPCWLSRAPLQWPQAGIGQALVLGDNSQERSQTEKKRFRGNLGSAVKRWEIFYQFLWVWIHLRFLNEVLLKDFSSCLGFEAQDFQES